MKKIVNYTLVGIGIISLIGGFFVNPLFWFFIAGIIAWVWHTTDADAV